MECGASPGAGDSENDHLVRVGGFSAASISHASGVALLADPGIGLPHEVAHGPRAAEAPDRLAQVATEHFAAPAGLAVAAASAAEQPVEVASLAGAVAAASAAEQPVEVASLAGAVPAAPVSEQRAEVPFVASLAGLVPVPRVADQ